MKLENPTLTEGEFVNAYDIRTPKNGGKQKVRADFQQMERKFVIRKPSPQIDMTKYLGVVTAAVPPLALATKKRRTRLTHERVAQFVAVKMHDAMQAGSNQAASGRETLIDFWETLKAKGVVDWQLTTNAHSKLIKVCTQYQLLEIHEEHTAPSAPGAKDGRCRRIGPGRALGEEYERYEFTRRRLEAEAVKPVRQRASA